jgi:plastocyanin
MVKKAFVLGVLIIGVLALVIAGCVKKNDDTQKDAGGPAAKEITVEIKDFQFKPATVTIAKGGVVTWKNLDASAHSVNGKNFDSGSMSKDDTYSFTFLDKGKFTYKCAVHPYMEGTVIVK